MSVPTEFDAATLKLGDGDSPEVFTISCGKKDINLNFAASSSDRFVPDCAKPFETPFRKTRVTGKQLDITAAGLTDATAFGTEEALVGKLVNAKVELLGEDGTDGGELIGTIACSMRVTSVSIGVPREGESSAEIVLASHGAWTYTPAP